MRRTASTTRIAAIDPRRALTFLAMSLLLLGLAACNTASGLGRDVSATGRAVSNTAEKAKP